MLKDVLYIIIPAYNEEENIRKVIDDWYPIIEKHNGNGKSRLVVIDDGSRDSTYKILNSCAKERELLCTMTKENGGHGATVFEGYKYALSKGADYVFQTDSDGQTIPSEFEQFWEQRVNYDFIIGHRVSRQDGWSRQAVTKVLKGVVRCIFGVNVTDANAPYRLMSAGSLKDILSFVPDGYNLTNVIVSVVYAKKKYAIKDIPITFRPRQGGVNSINIRKIIGIGWHALKSFYMINQKIERNV